MNNTYGIIRYFCRDAGYSLVHGNYIQRSYRDFLRVCKRTEKEQAHEKAEGHQPVLYGRRAICFCRICYSSIAQSLETRRIS